MHPSEFPQRSPSLVRPSRRARGDASSLVAAALVGLPIVLIAEDDHDTRRLLADILRHQGSAVLDVPDGSRLEDASLALRERAITPSLLVADLDLPGRDILATMARMRAWGWTMPILVVTTSTERAARRCARSGVTAIFDKPLDPRCFRAIAAGLLDR